MSNSIKHHKFAAFCGGSNSIWKRDANRELRRVNKQRIHEGKEPKLMREQANLYNSPRDGSVHFVQNAFTVEAKFRPRGLRLALKNISEFWKAKAFRK